MATARSVYQCGLLARTKRCLRVKVKEKRELRISIKSNVILSGFKLFESGRDHMRIPCQTRVRVETVVNSRPHESQIRAPEI